MGLPDGLGLAQELSKQCGLWQKALGPNSHSAPHWLGV